VGKEGSVEVSIFPFQGLATADGLRGVLTRTRLGPDTDLTGATVVAMSEVRSRKGGPAAFVLETERPRAVVVAIASEGALYVLHGRATARGSRKWDAVKGDLQRAAVSFELL